MMKRGMLCIMLATTLILCCVFNISANEVSVLWTNVKAVYVGLGMDEGKAVCLVTISASDYTEKIENITILLTQKCDNIYTVIEKWEPETVYTPCFDFTESIAVQEGATYIFSVTADVCCNGYSEHIEESNEKTILICP